MPNQLGISDPRTTLQQGHVGRFISAAIGLLAIVSAIPSVAGTPQVITISSGAPANSTAYSLRVVSEVFGIDEVITTDATDGSATAAELEILIAAAWNGHYLLSGMGTAVASTDCVITMADYTRDFTITEVSTSVLTITETTAPSAASSFPFGRWVEQIAPSGVLRNTKFRAISAPTQAKSTLTITHSGGADYTVEINAFNDHPDIAPIAKLVSFSAGGSAALTDAAAVSALAAAFPGTGFVVTNPSTGSVVLTLPVGWRVASHSPTASAGDLTVADTAATIPSLGWVLDPEDVASLTLGGSVIAVRAEQGVSLVKSAPQATVGVEASGATPAYGGIVYVETAAGANNGRPYTVQSATGSRLALPGVIWYGVDAVASSVHHVQFTG